MKKKKHHTSEYEVHRQICLLTLTSIPQKMHVCQVQLLITQVHDVKCEGQDKCWQSVPGCPDYPTQKTHTNTERAMYIQVSQTVGFHSQDVVDILE